MPNKLVLRVEVRTGLPVLGLVYEATYDERRAVLELLDELRFNWPEAPVAHGRSQGPVRACGRRRPGHLSAAGVRRRRPDDLNTSN